MLSLMVEGRSWENHFDIVDLGDFVTIRFRDDQACDSQSTAPGSGNDSGDGVKTSPEDNDCQQPQGAIEEQHQYGSFETAVYADNRSGNQTDRLGGKRLHDTPSIASEYDLITTAQTPRKREPTSSATQFRSPRPRMIRPRCQSDSAVQIGIGMKKAIRNALSRG